MNTVGTSPNTTPSILRCLMYDIRYTFGARAYGGLNNCHPIVPSHPFIIPAHKTNRTRTPSLRYCSKCILLYGTKSEKTLLLAKPVSAGQQVTQKKKKIVFLFPVVFFRGFCRLYYELGTCLALCRLCWFRIKLRYLRAFAETLY